MTAYTFCRFNDLATMSTNLCGIILWQMETYFVKEKREIHMIAIEKVIDGTLQVVGQVPRKLSSICLIFM